MYHERFETLSIIGYKLNGFHEWLLLINIIRNSINALKHTLPKSINVCIHNSFNSRYILIHNNKCVTYTCINIMYIYFLV